MSKYSSSTWSRAVGHNDDDDDVFKADYQGPTISGGTPMKSLSGTSQQAGASALCASYSTPQAVISLRQQVDAAGRRYSFSMSSSSVDLTSLRRRSSVSASPPTGAFTFGRRTMSSLSINAADRSMSTGSDYADVDGVRATFRRQESLVETMERQRREAISEKLKAIRESVESRSSETRRQRPPTPVSHVASAGVAMPTIFGFGRTMSSSSIAMTARRTPRAGTTSTWNGSTTNGVAPATGSRSGAGSAGPMRANWSLGVPVLRDEHADEASGTANTEQNGCEQFMTNRATESRRTRPQQPEDDDATSVSKPTPLWRAASFDCLLSENDARQTSSSSPVRRKLPEAPVACQRTEDKMAPKAEKDKADSNDEFLPPSIQPPPPPPATLCPADEAIEDEPKHVVEHQVRGSSDRPDASTIELFEDVGEAAPVTSLAGSSSAFAQALRKPRPPSTRSRASRSPSPDARAAPLPTNSEATPPHLTVPIRSIAQDSVTRGDDDRPGDEEFLIQKSNTSVAPRDLFPGLKTALLIDIIDEQPHAADQDNHEIGGTLTKTNQTGKMTPDSGIDEAISSPTSSGCRQLDDLSAENGNASSSDQELETEVNVQLETKPPQVTSQDTLNETEKPRAGDDVEVLTSLSVEITPPSLTAPAAVGNSSEKQPGGMPDRLAAETSKVEIPQGPDWSNAVERVTASVRRGQDESLVYKDSIPQHTTPSDRAAGIDSSTENDVSTRELQSEKSTKSAVGAALGKVEMFEREDGEGVSPAKDELRKARIRAELTNGNGDDTDREVVNRTKIVTKYQILDFVLTKSSAGVGFCIEGGDSIVGRRNPISVKRLFKGDTWAKGYLQAGDEIVKVNAMSFALMNHFQAWEFLKAIPDGLVHVTVKRKLTPAYL